MSTGDPDLIVDLKWDPNETAVATSPTDATPSILTALEEQLGLKLEPARGLLRFWELIERRTNREPTQLFSEADLSQLLKSRQTYKK